METMKKKLIAAAALLVAVVPCFAEIRVQRGGYTEHGVTVNVACFWNDRYLSLSKSAQLSVKEMAKKMAKDFRKDLSVDVECTFKFYYDHEGFYQVVIKRIPGISPCFVNAIYCNNGYEEVLDQSAYSSYNLAKAKFDSLCQRYYNKIAK